MIMILKELRIINPDSEIKGDIEIEGELIKGVGRNINYDGADLIIPMGGRIAMPGFIDLHIQGAGGSDILDGKPEDLANISRVCARFGVTSFLATTIFRPNSENRHIRNLVNHMDDELGGARILGVHLEGPFISIQRKGMIDPSAICDPSIELFEKILDECRGKLRMMTIAPELKGASSVIDILIANGIIASFGHSSANYEQTLDAFKMGVSHVTHLFNAMEPMHHRLPGPVPAIFESEHVTAQIISDGIHVHPAMVKLAARNLGEKRCVTITDGVRALGLPDGEYEYDGRSFRASGGVARYEDGTLIGTTLGMNELGRRFINFADWGLKALVKIASWNPAKILGFQETKGRIEVNRDADIIILNSDLSVRMTIVRGKIVYDQTG